MIKFLPKLQFGSQKGSGAQKCLVSLIELRKASVGSKNAFGALLTELSKAFSCFNHELLITKLHAHDIDFTLLKLIRNYLNNWKQKEWINNSFSTVFELNTVFYRDQLWGHFSSASLIAICSTLSMRGKQQTTQMKQHRIQ